MVKVGIIGAGFMGKTHADGYKLLNNAKVEGIADVNAQAGNEFANEYNCKYYQDAEDLIKREDIDIIDICLPTFLHEKYAVMAASYGKHVLLEKPFTLTMEQADNILAAVKKAGVKFMVGQVIRFWPEYMKIKEFYEDGLLGDIKMVYACRLAQHPDWGEWFFDPEKSGGGLYDLHIHDIDFVRYLLGPVESVYATGKKSPNGAWNHVMSVLNFANGSKACVEGAYEMTENFPFTMGFRAVGTQGTADFTLSAGFNLEDRESAVNRLVLYRQGNTPEVINAEKKDAYANEVEYFVGCVERDEYPKIITPEDSRDVLGIVLAIKESLEEGRIVKL
jgi:UDP-N-acetylglucosamine 3-dehydrogenase